VFNTTMPSGEQIRYQVLRIAVPRKGRALPLPLLQLAYDRDNLPAKSQNQIEQDALLGVVRALASGICPVILADRGFARATFFRWLQNHHLHYVVGIDKGTCLRQSDGHRWKLGEEGLRPGQLRWAPNVRYGLYHGRPRTIMLSTWPCAGGCPRAERRTLGASNPRSPGTWPRAWVVPEAPPRGSGSGAG
jgi:hypothetical protein